MKKFGPSVGEMFSLFIVNIIRKNETISVNMKNSIAAIRNPTIRNVPPLVKAGSVSNRESRTFNLN